MVKLMFDEFDQSGQTGNEDKDDNDEREIILDERNISEIETRSNEERDPEYCPEDAEEEKSQIGHPADAGHERREGPDDRQESGDNDGLPPVFLVESLCPVEIRAIEEPRLGRAENPRSDCTTDPIIDVVSRERGCDKERSCDFRVEGVNGGKGSHGEEERIARKKRGDDKPRFAKYDNEEEKIDPGAVRRAELEKMPVKMEGELHERFERLHGNGSLDRNKLHFKNERCTRLDVIARSAVAVCEVGRDKELPFGADGHQLKRFRPTFNDVG